MAKIKDKTVEEKLADTKSIHSQDTYYSPDIDIKYSYSSDEINGIYAGQDLWLTAELGYMKREDYIYTWSIDGGRFRGIKSRVNQQKKCFETVEDLQTVCITTNSVKTDPVTKTGQITATVTATPR